MATKKKPLFEALSDAPNSVRRERCGVAVILDALDNDEKEILLNRIEEIRTNRVQKPFKMSPVSALWLATVLSDNGFPVTDRVLNHHIRGNCSCR